MAVDAIVKIYHNVPLYPDTEHYILMDSEDTFLTTLNTKYLKRTYNTVLDPRNLVEGGSVQLDGSYAEYSTCNYMYLAVQRNGQSFRRYAFVTNITYKNDNSFIVDYQIDNFTSFIYQMEKTRTGYVVREHTNNDAIGANKCDEGLDTGEYLHKTKRLDMSQIPVVIVASTKSPTGENVSGGYYGGVYNGSKLYAYKSNQMNELQDFINTANTGGYIDAISNMFMVPEYAVKFNEETHEVTSPSEYGYMKIDAPKNYYQDGYTPKNNKLFTYPYCYPTVINNQGGSLQLEYDLWTGTNEMNFGIYATPAQGECVALYPLNYIDTVNNIPNFTFTLGLGSFPSVSWQYDQYSNWLAQNQWQRAQSLIFGVARGAVGMGMSESEGGFLMSAIGMLDSATSYIAQDHDKQVLPNITQNAGNYADINMAIGNKKYSVVHNYLHYQYAKRIDDYFTAFGYKTMELKQPNFYGRKNWNYLKLINYPIMGDIPNIAQQTIRALFDNGVTLWHTFDVGNYSLDNSII